MNIDKYWIWLSKLEGITPREKLSLIKKYGIENLWSIDKSQAFEVLNDKQKVDEIFEFKNKDNLDKILEYNYKNNIKLISINNENYPSVLKNIYDAPIVLYLKGNEKLLQNLGFSLVGARSASEYGKKIAKTFAYMLAKENINIISGLANGIDTYSHIGAVNANGNTTAVMGTGLDIIYPKENVKLYNTIIKKRWISYFRICSRKQVKAYQFSSKKQDYKRTLLWSTNSRSK